MLFICATTIRSIYIPDVGGVDDGLESSICRTPHPLPGDVVGADVQMLVTAAHPGSLALDLDRSHGAEVDAGKRHRTGVRRTEALGDGTLLRAARAWRRWGIPRCRVETMSLPSVGRSLLRRGSGEGKR
jgi:hypothetical protein